MNDIKYSSYEKYIVRMLIAWLFVNTILLIFSRQKYNTINFLNNTNLLVISMAILITFVVQMLLLKKEKSMIIDKIILFMFAFIYFEVSILINANIYYFAGTAFIMGILINYCLINNNSELMLGEKVLKLSYIIFSLMFILFVGGLTSLRYLSYNAPGFDFGIFTQMFNNMKTSFAPNTTCELDYISSHFAVHISPIYYIILPFYFLFPNPITLQIAQSVILASGLIPIYLLCRKFKLPNFVAFTIGICYCFYPALSGGCFYDIHENAFLTPLILWFLYFIEKEKWWGILSFSILIFMVKEDAPVYVAFIAIYMIIGKKQFKKGTVVFIISLLYFIIALWLLKKYGQGAKFDRYDNYNYDGSGLFAIIKTFVMNPAYILSQCMTKDKLIFAFKMLAPLALLPILNKNYAKYILLGPFILVNLMSNYPYQHSIEFQYNFGVIAIFFYLVISNLNGIKPRLQNILIIFCAVATVLLFSFTTLNKVLYINQYITDKKRITSMNACVDIIPENATVSASSFIVPHLYKHKILYELPTKNETEYIVFDLGVKTEGSFLSDYLNDDYQEIYFDQGIVALFKRK